MRQLMHKIRDWAEPVLWRRRLVVLVAVPLFLPFTFAEFVAGGVQEWFRAWYDVWPEVVNFWKGGKL